jgi:hypothetical protein
MSLEGVGASFALFKVFGTGDGEEGHGGKFSVFSFQFSVFSFHGRGEGGGRGGSFQFSGEWGLMRGRRMRITNDKMELVMTVSPMLKTEN